MARFKYGLFYDFHTSTTIPDVGANFDVEKFTDEVKSCGVDFLTCHARCNQGNAYYDTSIGMRHPSLKFDMFGDLAKACRRKGIKLSAYMNGSLSDEELIAHREWMTVFVDGTMVRPKNGPWARVACYNSPYRDHLRDMALELIRKYDVDGFFFDCLCLFPCVCEHCIKEMKELGYDYTNEESARKFSDFSVARLCRFLNDAIRSEKPDALIYFNSRPFETIVDMSSHLECECLTTTWGYDYLYNHAHYLRTVAGPDKSVMNMNGRFHDWGDFGGLRSEVGLEYDLFYGLANGMRPDVGGHMHPRGDIDMPVFDAIRNVYKNIQQYDKWCDNAVNQAEIGIVAGRNSFGSVDFNSATGSAVRMLEELKYQFDLVTDFVQWDSYKLLIFPDTVEFTEEIAKRVDKFIRNGGKVLATARSGMPAVNADVPELKGWPVKYADPLPFNPLYFNPAGDLAKGLPLMPLSVYAGGVTVKPVSDASVEMRVVKPYSNIGWDGLRANFYTPPQCETEYPFVVTSTNVIYCSCEIFNGYAKFAPHNLRKLLANMIGRLLPEPKLKAPSLPSFARAFVQTSGNDELVHVLAYAPEIRGRSNALEDRGQLVNKEILLRLDGRKVKSVYLAPDKKRLEFSVEGKYCKVTLPFVEGYALAVFEYC